MIMEMGQVFLPVVFCLAILARASHATSDGIVIDVTHRPEVCEVKAANGNYVSVHYVGKLADGTEFDNSFSRGEPIEFKLGAQEVISGWEEGILGMCVGEKRRLEIPPHLAYGDEGIGPIPGGATLVFDTELVHISDEPLATTEGYDETYQQFGEGEEFGASEQLGEFDTTSAQVLGDEDDTPAE